MYPSQSKSTHETSEESAQQHRRKFTRLIAKNITKKERACACAFFLKNCLEYNVVPQSLLIKPPQVGGPVDPETANKYKTCAQQASINNVKIASKDANKRAHEERSRFSEFFSGILTGLEASERDFLIKYKEQREPQISRNLKRKFHQKLSHLKKKQCKSDKPIRDTDGFKAPSKPFRTQRRFLKRNKYRKWKQKEAQKQVDLVVNLSNFTLSEPMQKVLNRGLSFVPTPVGVNKSELIADFSRYERSIKWKNFFFQEEPHESDGESEEDTQPRDLFKQKKFNLPQAKTHPAISDYLGGLRSDILGSIKKKVNPNIAEEEMQAIKELQKAQKEGKIIIKPADKAGGITLMEKSDYVTALEKQLKSVHTNNDGTCKNYYEKATEQDLRDVQIKVSHLITEGASKGFISKNDSKHMAPSKTPGRLYGLPKCHKEAKDGPLPPLRPIISNSGSVTEQISHFVDLHARAEVTKMESYVEDTPDMLRQFEAENAKGPQPPGSFPVTIDIVNMYGNIPIDGPQGGLAAFERAMNKREDKSVPTYFLVALLSLILRGNIFEFAGQLWRQLIGTAMGTRTGPTYANLFMGWLEVEKLLGLWQGTTPHRWRRYIDDILFFWRSSEEELLKFLEHLNAQHPFIKFTITYNTTTKSVPFLDTQVSINESGFIETDLYKKSSAKVQYLLPQSCHPSHICKNIPYSLGYRLLRICSKEETFKQRLQELKEDLISRSYHIKVIQEAFDRLKEVSRTDALKKVTREQKSSRDVLSITYHPALPPISQLVKKHHKVMIQEPSLQRCFPKPSMVGYKRAQNLSNLLVRAKVPAGIRSSREKNNGFKRCGRPCEMCMRSSEDLVKDHMCQRTGQKWKITAPLTCLSTNVIYRLTCKKCPQAKFLYIGETQRRACDRFTDHRGYVTQGRTDQPAGQHFSLKGHTTMDMIFLPIERVLPAEDAALRKTREKVWIRHYDSTTFGKNTRT